MKTTNQPNIPLNPSYRIAKCPGESPRRNGQSAYNKSNVKSCYAITFNVGQMHSGFK